MTDEFEENWVKRTDIDSLLKLTKSKLKCDCFLNPLSSYIPSDSADLGGYAIALIKSYKDKKRMSFGLYSCPKTSDKEAEELITWWTHQK